MGRREPFSVEEHRRLASYLVETSQRLTEITVVLSNRGPKGSARVRRSVAALRAVDDLRAMLDDELAELQREEFDQKIYYPGRLTPELPPLLGDARG